MADVLFVLIILALFGLASLLVVACDRIIGPGDEVRDDVDPAIAADAAPEPAPEPVGI